MTRRLAVALVFLEVRMISGVTGWKNLGPSVEETIVWVCVGSSLFLTDVVLQWQERNRNRATAAKLHTAVR
jgi:hypothetical protein